MIIIENVVDLYKEKYTYAYCVTKNHFLKCWKNWIEGISFDTLIKFEEKNL